MNASNPFLQETFDHQLRQHLNRHSDHHYRKSLLDTFNVHLLFLHSSSFIRPHLVLSHTYYDAHSITSQNHAYIVRQTTNQTISLRPPLSHYPSPYGVSGPSCTRNAQSTFFVQVQRLKFKLVVFAVGHHNKVSVAKAGLHKIMMIAKIGH